MPDGIVSRNESNTERFGRVITYRVTLDGVTFQAERMVGLNDDYTVYSHVGRCGHSGRSNIGTVAGGSRIAARFLALATELRADPARFVDPKHADSRTHSSALCCDKDACDRFRVAHPTDPNVATDAERETARVAGVYQFNRGHQNVWHESPTMRAMLDPGDQYTARGRALIGIFEAEWERNADYCRRRDAATAGA